MRHQQLVNKLFYACTTFFISTTVFALNCKQYNLTPNPVCKNKNVHLTFDDGPNTTTTPKVLATLKRQGVPATFFISTHQLEKGDLTKKKELMNQMLDANFTIASHGHDHNCHDYRYDWKGNFEKGYTDEQRREQVSKSINLLNEFTDNRFAKQKNQLIRFPYGRGISPSKKEIQKMINDGRHIPGNNYAEQLAYYRAHSPAMSIASEYKLSHIGWNLDSADSTSTYSSNNKDKYVLDTVSALCRGSNKNVMTLFHDTRAINSYPSSYDKNNTVMDEIIEKAKCLGVNFVSMDEMLDSPLQDGVYTKAYKSKDVLGDFIAQIEAINSSETPLACAENELSMQNVNNLAGKPCVSEYIGNVNHCEGNVSFCIDGTWTASKDIYELVCLENLSADIGKKVSSKYLRKECSIPGKREAIGANQEVACYCQESGSENQLYWNCFDIRQTPPRKIN